MKEPPKNICKRTLDIGFEWDWSVGLSTMLGDGHTECNTYRPIYISSFRDFLGKIDSVLFLSFECTINPQNLIKIVEAIF